MAYDENLAERIDEVLVGVPNVVQKKMFGGIAFMVRSHMCVGVIGDTLLARVGPDQYEDSLKENYANEMLFTGRPMKGMIYIEPEGINSKAKLIKWVEKCLYFVSTLPEKKEKLKKKR